MVGKYKPEVSVAQVLLRRLSVGYLAIELLFSLASVTSPIMPARVYHHNARSLEP